MYEVWFFDDECHELEATFATQEEANAYADLMNRIDTYSSEDYYEVFPQGAIH